MTEMLALGAPVLPSGHFYRISHAGFGYMKLAIRKDRRFGSTELTNVIFHPDNYHDKDVEESIKYAAEKAVEQWEFQKVSMARYQRLEKWKGDHK